MVFEVTLFIFPQGREGTEDYPVTLDNLAPWGQMDLRVPQVGYFVSLMYHIEWINVEIVTY